jgi:hypothetical protein
LRNDQIQLKYANQAVNNHQQDQKFIPRNDKKSGQRGKIDCHSKNFFRNRRRLQKSTVPGFPNELCYHPMTQRMKNQPKEAKRKKEENPKEDISRQF